MSFWLTEYRGANDKAVKEAHDDQDAAEAHAEALVLSGVVKAGLVYVYAVDLEESA